MIKEEAKKLVKPVKLNVFTSSKKLKESEYMMQILEIYKNNSNGNLTIEEYKLEKNSDYAEKYNIQKTPVIILSNDEGEEIIRYLAVPMGAEIQPFVNALMILTGAPNYYEKMINKFLNKIKPATIQVMITESCAYCPSVLSICTQFALASKGKIKTKVIDIMAHSDIDEKYNISTVPYVIVNENEPLVGNVGAKKILKQLIDEDL